MRKIVFQDKAWSDILLLINENNFSKLSKIIKIIEECKRSPFKGTGKPEPLKGDFKNYWSRRINLTDRLVYKLEENNIYIFSILGHYD